MFLFGLGFQNFTSIGSYIILFILQNVTEAR
nr:MAG TPA: hypothetical protein [Caudoviricetes sp.]